MQFRLMLSTSMNYCVRKYTETSQGPKNHLTPRVTCGVRTPELLTGRERAACPHLQMRVMQSAIGAAFEKVALAIKDA